MASWTAINKVLPAGWEWWCFLSSEHQRGTLSTVFSSKLPSTTEIWTCWKDSNKRPQCYKDWTRTSFLWGESSRLRMFSERKGMLRPIHKGGRWSKAPLDVQMTGPEEIGTNENTAGTIWTSGNTFSLWSGTGCPERLWSFHPSRYWKVEGWTRWSLPISNTMILWWT